jgi:3-hydroxyisobutyrate dehydrogenase-like beta-hydroxyacid dehydrogenase
MRIGFIGLGRMGLPMTRHIVGAGHDVIAFDISEQARARAEQSGAEIASSVSDLADAEIVCSSLPATEHVEAAYFGSGGLVDLLAPGTACIDLSTISITGSRALAARCRERGVEFVDAPVSGTSIHAEAGTLVVMAGGQADVIERARPALEPFASRVERVGDNGAGLELKLITNRLLTTHLVAIAEAIVSIEQTDLSVPQCIELLRSGAVPKLLDYKARPLADRDFTPQFTVDLMRKDLRLAAAELAKMPLASAAHEIVEATSSSGLGDDDLAAIITIVEQRLG